jgi:proteasome lid subunit RPN8/RPN11
MSRQLRLALSQRSLDKMIDLAWSAYPAEAVGLVGGTRGTVRSVYGLRNLAPCWAFFADPYEQFLAMQKMTANRERLIATFHSHPEGAVQLSEADRLYVFEVATTAIVIALRAASHTARIAAFSRVTGREEETIEIVVREPRLRFTTH